MSVSGKSYPICTSTALCDCASVVDHDGGSVVRFDDIIIIKKNL